MDGACRNLYDYNVRLLSPLFPLRVLAALLQIDWYVHMQSENGSICIHNQPKKRVTKVAEKFLTLIVSIPLQRKTVFSPSLLQ